jgi:hypothetical protein
MVLSDEAGPRFFFEIMHDKPDLMARAVHSVQTCEKHRVRRDGAGG